VNECVVEAGIDVADAKNKFTSGDSLGAEFVGFFFLGALFSASLSFSGCCGLKKNKKNLMSNCKWLRQAELPIVRSKQYYVLH